MHFRRLKRISAAAAVILLILAVAFLLRREQQPRHAGKPLDDWLAQYNTSQILSWPRQAHSADVAIRALGTNCFPAIVQRLIVRDSRAKHGLARTLRTLRLPVSFQTQEQAHLEALAALGALGSTAVPLVPILAESLESMSLWHRISAAYWLGGSLGHDGEAAIPTFVRLLQDQREQVFRHIAVQTLSQIGAKRPEIVLPLLQECLKDTNRFVQLQARNELTRQWWKPAPPPPDFLTSNLFQLSSTTDSRRAAALSYFRDSPVMAGQVVPLVTSNLFSPNNRLVEASAKALAAYGGEAEQALPLLTNLLFHPRGYVRVAASNAVQRISSQPGRDR